MFLHRFVSNEYLTIWRVIFTVTVLLLLYLTLTPQPPNPISFRNIDKLYHLIAFAGLSFVFKIAFSNLKTSLIVIISSLLGIFIEIAQYFIPGRGFSVADMVVDIIGALLGLIVAHYFTKQAATINKNLNS